MILEPPTSLPAILRNERRRIIADRIRREIAAETSLLDAFSRIAVECKCSNEEVLQIMDQMVQGNNTLPEYAR